LKNDFCCLTAIHYFFDKVELSDYSIFFIKISYKIILFFAYCIAVFGTGKTLLADTVLSTVMSEENIGRIVSETNSSFRFSDAIDKWITLLNDFR
jgi:hypothetical protein